MRQQMQTLIDAAHASLLDGDVRDAARNGMVHIIDQKGRRGTAATALADSLIGYLTGLGWQTDLAAAVAEAETALRANKVDAAPVREQQVVRRLGCNAVVWTVLDGERLTNRRLPPRLDLFVAGDRQLALDVLAWFTTENEALEAHGDFHDGWVAPLHGGEFTVTGEQVLDWLINWRLTNKETQRDTE